MAQREYQIREWLFYGIIVTMFAAGLLMNNQQSSNPAWISLAGGILMMLFGGTQK